MEPEEVLRLVRAAARRIDNQQPISHEMGEALLLYASGLEQAVQQLREQNAELRGRLYTRMLIDATPPPYLQ